jgi:hypothetical protein
MKPEIESYLREHGDRYTEAALRDQLLQAGHPAEEVDAALRERAAAHAAQAHEPGVRRRFWRWAWGLHIAAWLLLGLWVLLQEEGTFRYGENSIGLVILGIALLIGLAISGFIGRAIAERTSLAAGLVVPAISAVLLAGSCFGILGGMS